MATAEGWAACGSGHCFCLSRVKRLLLLHISSATPERWSSHLGWSRRIQGGKGGLQIQIIYTPHQISTALFIYAGWGGVATVTCIAGSDAAGVQHDPYSSAKTSCWKVVPKLCSHQTAVSMHLGGLSPDDSHFAAADRTMRLVDIRHSLSEIELRFILCITAFNLNISKRPSGLLRTLIKLVAGLVFLFPRWKDTCRPLTYSRCDSGIEDFVSGYWVDADNSNDPRVTRGWSTWCSPNNCKDRIRVRFQGTDLYDSYCTWNAMALPTPFPISS